MHDIMQPLGDGGQYVAGYGKDGTPVIKTEPNQPNATGFSSLGAFASFQVFGYAG